MRKSIKKFHLLVYVQDCCTRMKKFKDIGDMQKFVDRFHKQHKSNLQDNWVDYFVTDIAGTVVIVDDSLRMDKK